VTTHVPCVLVLNKCDFGASRLKEAQLDEFCRENKVVDWVAVSAKVGTNLTQAFEKLINSMRQMGAHSAAAAQASTLLPPPADAEVPADRQSGGQRMYKVLMTGGTAVGKTCILRRYCLEHFNDQTVPTLGCDFMMKTLPHYDTISTDVKLQIWDVAGQDYAPASVSPVFFRGAFGVIVACDITNARSYEVAAQWKRCIDEKVFFPGTTHHVPCVLMLNKCDLGGSHLDETQLDDFCRENTFVGWFAVSAMDGSNVNEAFEKLIDSIRVMDAQRAANMPAVPPAPQPAAQVQIRDQRTHAGGKDAGGKKEKKECAC
jgi:Ras-related protein Rab-32